jgi:hypothetical protein
MKFRIMAYVAIIWLASIAGCNISPTRVDDYVLPGYDSKQVVRYSRDGNCTWVYDKRLHAIDATPLNDNKILVAYLPSEFTDNKGGVRIIDKNGRAIFDYSLKDEVMSCLPLDNGNILFVECHSGRISELNLDGKIVHSFDVKAKGMGHRTVRMIRMTPQNTILAGECYSNILREYTREGKLIREFPLEMAYGGYRLENGNTLITGYSPGRVIEVDKKGNIVWEVSVKELPEDMKIAHFVEAIRLDNGNTLIRTSPAYYNKDVVMLFEVTPDKKVVWKIRNTKVNGLHIAK